MSWELNKYFNHLLDSSNPFFYALTFTILFLSFFYIFYANLYLPYKRKAQKEKKELEYKNLKLMAIFAEMDPNPVIRIDNEGIIKGYNKAAYNEFNIKDYSSICDFLPDISIHKIKLMHPNKSFEFNKYINEKYYSVILKTGETLDFFQVYFTDLTERKIFENKLIESEKKFKDLSFYNQEQLECEKIRIGRELHDSIGQNLLLIKMKLGEVLKDEENNPGYSEIKKALDDTLFDLREIIFDLKPRILDDLGLIPAVQKLTENLVKNSKITGTVNVSGEINRMDTFKELYLFRIIQECLNNIVKHSRAKEFSIHFSFNNNQLKLIVYDDGIGFNLNNGNKGSGLFNIEERIKTLNGNLKISSSKDEGTILVFNIPLNNI